MDAVRSLWTLIEPYHAVVYFGRDMRQALDDLGIADLPWPDEPHLAL